MTDGQNGIKKRNNVYPDNKRKKKNSGGVFGLMSKRRWFIVVVFLSSLTWSYTAGPPLSEAYISNRYFTDPQRFDYSTERVYGNEKLVWSIFEEKFWKYTLIWQAGAYFEWLEGPCWINNKLYFSDVIGNRIYSYNDYQGTQIEIENSGDATKKDIQKLYEPGSNGLLADPTNNNRLYIAQHGARRIILLNLQTGKKEVIVDEYNGKKFNSPNDMAIDFNNEYLYFTDPVYGRQLKSKVIKTPSISVKSETYADKLSDLGFAGIYRVNINPKSKSYKKVELIDKSLHRPNGIAISKSHKKSKNERLYVTNSILNEFNVNVYEIVNNKVKFVESWTTDSIQSNLGKNEKILGNGRQGSGLGTTDGLIVYDKLGYLLITCPESKLCIVNEQTGKLEAALKFADGVVLSNVEIGKDHHFYATANGNLWQIRMV